MTNNIEIVVGTYEEFLVGYKVKNNGGDIELSNTFATHSHTGSIKCVASAGSFVASGGTDDKIVILDMLTRTENRVLIHHNGTVNSVAFTEKNSHIFSGGTDGSLYAIKTGNWQIEKHWAKAHKGSPITHIAIHPSNKMALTIGGDSTLRTWNLIKGRQAYVTNLKSKGFADPSSIIWNPDGRLFCLTGYSDIAVWSIDDASIMKTLKCSSKTNCMTWISSVLTAVGLENGEIVLFDLNSNKSYNFKGHSQRVKCIAFHDNYIYTASSSGEIKIWEFNSEEIQLIEKVSVNTDCRITCLTLVNSDEFVKEEIIDENNDGTTIVKNKRKHRSLEEEKDISVNDDIPKKKKAPPKPYVSVVTENSINEKNVNIKKKNRNKKNKK